MALRFGKKKYSTVHVRKRDVPDGLWEKCPGCNEILYAKELEASQQVCPKCGYHFPLGRQKRIEMFADEGTFVEWDADMTSADPLGFTGKDSYIAKLESNQKKTGFKDAVTCGAAKLNGREIGLGVMDFAFLGASMGSVVGEKITRLMARITASLATAETIPDYVVMEKPGRSMGKANLRAYLGTVPDYASSDVVGVRLSGVAKGGPAERAGHERKIRLSRD